MYEYLDTEQNRKSLQIKNAVNNRLGDIFEPESTCTTDLDSFDPTMYKTPHKKHSHGHDMDDDWNYDIVYKNGKCAPLLLGEIDKTFVWEQPIIIFTRDRGVGNMKLTLEELFKEGKGAFLEACK